MTIDPTRELTAAIRQAERCGMTRYQMSKASGVSQAQLSRLSAGIGTVRLDTAERIARVLGLRIALVKR